MRHSLRLVTLLSLAVAASALAVPTSAPPPVDELVLASAKEVPPLVLGGTADSQDGAVAPAPTAGSVLGSFFSQFLTPSGIASIVVTVLGLVGGALGLSAVRKRQIAIVTQHAFHAVEDFSATTDTVVDDKIAAGLKVADEWMRAQGWRALKADEQAVVKLGFTALNGAQVLAEKVAANAQVEATKVLTSPATRRELDAIARGEVATAVPPSAS